MEITPQKLKLARKAKGWGVEVPARLYGEYTRGRPFDVHTVYRLEEDFMPQDEKRRWILSRMYNIAPALFGLSMTRPTRAAPISYKVRPVEVKEYQETLISYWKNGYEGTAKEALIDLSIRINSLEKQAWYAPEKEQMKRLLCGYQMRSAQIAREVGYDKAALDYLNNAIILATENDYEDLSAAAFFRRGEFHFHRWELKKAFQNFRAAERSTSAPPDVLGCVKAVKGVTLARMARSEKDMAAALEVVRESKKLIRADIQEMSCMLDFPNEQYNKNYVKALVGSPVSKLHQPDEADRLITAIYRETMQTAQNHDEINGLLLTARIYLDKGYHAAATSLLEDVLELIEKGYRIYLPEVEHGYQMLLESPYGKSVEVAELGLQLLVVQMPHQFKARPWAMN